MMTHIHLGESLHIPVTEEKAKEEIQQRIADLKAALETLQQREDALAEGADRAKDLEEFFSGACGASRALTNAVVFAESAPDAFDAPKAVEIVGLLKRAARALRGTRYEENAEVRPKDFSTRLEWNVRSAKLPC